MFRSAVTVVVAYLVATLAYVLLRSVSGSWRSSIIHNKLWTASRSSVFFVETWKYKTCTQLCTFLPPPGREDAYVENASNRDHRSIPNYQLASMGWLTERGDILRHIKSLQNCILYQRQSFHSALTVILTSKPSSITICLKQILHCQSSSYVLSSTLFDCSWPAFHRSVQDLLA